MYEMEILKHDLIPASAPVQTSQILKTIWVVAAAAVHIIDAKRNIIIVEGHLMTQRSLQKL